MNLHDMWQKALSKTRIIRPAVMGLCPTADSQMPYTFLAESALNRGDTVVRSGEVTVSKPTIVLPYQTPQFEGFDFEEHTSHDQDMVMGFFLVRGVQFPSMKFNNQTSSLDLFEGGMEKAVSFHGNLLERREDSRTTLLSGPEDTWVFSILIFLGLQAERSAGKDLRAVFERWKGKPSLN
ncbi:MAG: hypothetical protein HQL11_04185 [Candidatus Omnitrophica bacterium]|nr:hypothetical protein [Candidatus Omnitrophota bacterium]